LLKQTIEEQPWALLVTGFLALMLIVGGTSQPAPFLRVAMSAASLALLAAGAWRLTALAPTAAGRVGLAFAVGVIGLFALQLLPLPPFLHDMLPGRAAIAETNALAGVAASWRPLSLSPEATNESLLAMLPALAFAIASLTVAARQRYLLAVAFVGVAIASVIVALAQQFVGSSTFHIYKQFVGYPSGFFANRNFFAAQLYASIPMLAVLALAGTRARLIPGWLAAIVALSYLGIVLLGLAVSGSRTGIVLCMAAILGCAFLPWGNIKTSRMGTRTKLLFYVTALVLFTFSQFGLVGLLRFAQGDPLEDYRVSILAVSWRALAAYFPIGAGFGSFVPVYQNFEAPETMLEAYVNHAHNDWLEIVLEGGAPALLLLAAFLAWFGWTAFRAWRRAGDSSGDLVMLAASLSASLLLLHSIVDYPLRTPALMSFFGLCMGLVASPFAARQLRLRPQFVPVEGAALDGVVRKPLKPFQPRQPELPGEPLP
jgi:O-antigen ligase